MYVHRGNWYLSALFVEATGQLPSLPVIKSGPICITIYRIY